MNWNWFYVLYSISFMFLIVTIIWYFVEKIIVLLSFLFNEYLRFILIVLLSIVPYYLNAALGSLVVLGNDPEQEHLYITFLAGAFILLNSAMGIVKVQRDMERNFDYSMQSLIKIRYVFMVLEIAFFIVCIYLPSLATTKLTLWVSEFASWIQRLFIINWIAAAASFFNALYIIITGIAVIIGMLGTLVFGNRK
ncbi:hypothetical protein D1872_203210 [compost metagenome]